MAKLNRIRRDPQLIQSWDETLDEAIEVNKELYVQGEITLSELEFRVGYLLKPKSVRLKFHPDGTPK